MIWLMFRYAFLAAPSADADAPKAAVTAHLAAAVHLAAEAAFPAAVATAAAAPLDGARS